MFAIGLRYLCGWAMATHPAEPRAARVAAASRPRIHGACRRVL